MTATAGERSPTRPTESPGASDLEQALALIAAGETRPAQAFLERAAALNPDLTQAWARLADQLIYVGDPKEAEAASLGLIRAAMPTPALRKAADALKSGRLPAAEQAARQILAVAPNDPDALLVLAETIGRLGRWPNAERLLARACEAAPYHSLVGLAHAEVLLRLGRWTDGLIQIDRLLAADPDCRRSRILRGTALGQIGDHVGAVDCSATLLQNFSDQPRAWLMHGHNLRTVGRIEDALVAYSRATALEPTFGEAYWSLANLKTYRFDPVMRTQMVAALDRGDLDAESRCSLHYALGKAHEDIGADAEAFDHYAKGAAVHHARIGYDPDRISALVARSKALLSSDFFAERRGWGAKARGPIFIVGLPRSGSTLIDQILASHPAIEGLGELQDLSVLANWVASQPASGPKSGQCIDYPDQLKVLTAPQVERLGEAYLDRTRARCTPGRSLFTDKAPGNFLHIGLILLALPHARIIDARRHPLGCCVSAFKQHFGSGWEFSYSLADLGRYYADYASLMAHIDAVRPGAVHRVIYETLVSDPEREVRRLLDYLDLPFDPACLHFYENDRAVATPSSQQVRQPIFTEAVDQWRRFEPWLDPLKTALGPALATYAGAL